MIAAGYEDCDDVDALRTDPALKIAIGRPTESGADLMSQPTLSRLENLPDWRALARVEKHAPRQPREAPAEINLAEPYASTTRTPPRTASRNSRSSTVKRPEIETPQSPEVASS